MTTVEAQPQPWESNLLALAQDAWSSVIHAFNAQVDAAQLRRAYQHCARLTAQHSKSFYLSSALLPDAKRKATRALYAFCRIGDDLIDQSAGDPASAIKQWSDIALAADPQSDDPV